MKEMFLSHASLVSIPVTLLSRSGQKVISLKNFPKF